jgi:hypothetical protein
MLRSAVEEGRSEEGSIVSGNRGTRASTAPKLVSAGPPGHPSCPLSRPDCPARGWSAAQTAERFFVTEATVEFWMMRLDEDGPSALVQTTEPVNGFPDFVAYFVRRLKVLCPAMGTARIAAALSRVGLHLGRTTVRRMLKHRPRRAAPIATAQSERCIRTLKEERVRRWLAPIRWRTVGRELALFADWYNSHRPHTGLARATPDEIHFGRLTAHRRPRFEPRARWPRAAACAQPQAPVRGRRGVRLAVEVRYLEGRAHLLIVMLTRAA